MTYLRRTGRTVPEPLTRTLARTGSTRSVVWSVRETGNVVGFVSAAVSQSDHRSHARGFRGFTREGNAVTPTMLSSTVADRTFIRDLTAARKDWA